MATGSSQYGECMTEEALFELLSLECRVDPYGATAYRNRDGHLHRVHGPAFTRLDGYCSWWQNGRRHRMDGPAVEYQDGNDIKFWFIDGKKLTEAEWQQAVSSMGIV